jgi:hypothetical protein
MATMHEAIASADTSWAAGSVMATLDIVLPAGATLKRFLIQNQIMTGTTTGAGFGSVANFYYGQNVSFTSGQYVDRVIFRKQYAVANELVVLYDNATLQRIYSQLINCGDETFFVDQRASYGLLSGPAFNLRLVTGNAVGPGFTGALSNTKYQVVFKAIYETSP